MSDEDQDTSVQFRWYRTFRGTMCLDDLEAVDQLTKDLPRREWTLTGPLTAGDDGHGSIQAPTLRRLLDQRFTLTEATEIELKAGCLTGRNDERKTVYVQLERRSRREGWGVLVSAEGEALRRQFEATARALGALADKCSVPSWRQRPLANDV